MKKIIQGDCLEKLKEIESESIDCIITDPPYGIGFMGKEWDTFKPDFLKKGIERSSRKDDSVSAAITAMTEAGFKTDFTSLFWTYATGFPKAMNVFNALEKRNGGAADSEVAALEGSYGGFQPKPAVEVIIVAMKPLSEKTFVDQALKNGKGITWLDDCRIGKSGGGTRGRFPANLLVSDDVLNDGIERKTGAIKPYKENHKNASSYRFEREKTYTKLQDSGSYSRYFDLDAWAKTLPFLIVAKAAKTEKNKGLENFEEHPCNDGRVVIADNAFQRGKTQRKNTHPTVKPIKLMSYLIMLVSKEGDIVLDPFAGSGTTLVAAKNLERNYIGIERESEYIGIIEARLKDIQPKLL